MLVCLHPPSFPIGDINRSDNKNVPLHSTDVPEDWNACLSTRHLETILSPATLFRFLMRLSKHLLSKMSELNFDLIRAASDPGAARIQIGRIFPLPRKISRNTAAHGSG